MKCPECGAWTLVKETRESPTFGHTRRRECANYHKFTTQEVVVPQEAIDEEGYYTALEEDGWMHDETEMWIWGPILIEGDNNFRLIIEADQDGNVIELKDIE